MFGRSQRDSGMVMERNNQISDAQRLHLLNSSQVQGKIERSWRMKNLMKIHRKDQSKLIRAIWMAVLSRPPLAAEEQEALAHGGESKLAVKQATDDLIWALVNSKEFLYHH